MVKDELVGSLEQSDYLMCMYEYTGITSVSLHQNEVYHASLTAGRIEA